MRRVKVLTVFLSLWLMASLVVAQTPEAVITVEAWSPQEITDLGWTSHRSTGLSVVGVGEQVYLFASETAGEDVTGVTWTIISQPTGSVMTLDSTNTQRTTFNPDTTGQFEVQAEITTASGTATAGVTITAAKYVGVGTIGGTSPDFAKGQCAACHSDKEQSWANTGHATKLEREISGLGSSHYNETCIECHTVGYFEGASNGGFWDIQNQLGWVFPDTLAPANWTDLVTNYPDLAAVANIQCESCHGPGSLHKGDKTKIEVTLDEGDCGQCHDEEPYHVKNAQWANSKHATGTTFARGTSSSCAPCHSGWGFIAAVDPGSNLDKTTGDQPITCAVCHDPHDATNEHQVRTVAPVELGNGVVISKGGNGLLCMNCHKSRRDAQVYAQEYHSHYGPHHGPQADMLFGTNVITWGMYLPSSTHRDVLENTCVSCHMSATPASGQAGQNLVGEHSFEMSAVDDMGTPADSTDDVVVDNVSVCQQCHGANLTSFEDIMAREDYDGDGTVESAEGEVEGMMEKVGMLLPPLGDPAVAVTSDYNKLQLNAAYNYLFVEEDKSGGLHNFQFTINLLKLTESALTYGVLTEGQITDIMDIPNDQGKQVRINWTRFGGDGVSDNPVQLYAIWRRVDDIGTTSAEKVEKTVKTLNLSSEDVSKFAVGTRLELQGEMWDYAGSVPAAGQDQYNAIVPTLYDTTMAEGMHWSVFKVSGHTKIPAIYAMTAPDSGYSVDNLSPAIPTAIVGEETDAGISLSWAEPVDEDFNYFALYRSTESGFDPASMQPIAKITEHSYVDSDVMVGSTYYYKLAAFDFAENQSGFSDEFALVVTSIDESVNGFIPDNYGLEQNYPNPFNPTTMINFGLKKSGFVKLTIYNAIGSEVMQLVNQEMPAGNHRVSVNAQDLSTGMYFYRIQVNGFTSVKKMILMK